uniref:Uncharacterized protein n=1 Tax=Panagrolaimus sp. ES5 TaxID=591445 RepID=A0AC34FPH4_9BILA
MNLEKINCKIWPTYYLDIKYKEFPKTFMSKLYQSDAKDVTLFSDINHLKDILFIASSAIDLALNAVVLGDEGQQLFVEDFIECFPLLESFNT